MTNEELIERAIQSAGDLEYKVKNFPGKRDIGILRIEGHPTYLRVIRWKKKQKQDRAFMVFNIEVYLVPENKTIAKRIVADHQLEVQIATG